MTESSEQNSNSAGIPRRTVIKAGAWAAPAVVMLAAVPAAVASDIPPVANYAFVGTVVNPRVGSNPNFSAYGVYEDANGDYVQPATIPAGTEFLLSFNNGATATSISALAGLTYSSGSIAQGYILYLVTADTSANIGLRVNGVSPVGGTIIATILGGAATGTIRE